MPTISSMSAMSSMARVARMALRNNNAVRSQIRTLSVLSGQSSHRDHNNHNNHHNHNHQHTNVHNQHYGSNTILAMVGASAAMATFSTTAAQCESKPSTPKVGDPFPLQPTHATEIPGPKGIPSRSQQLRNLQSSHKSDPYDVLVIGGGATGAGVAFDAATRGPSREGLKVACIERGDFASETSSRSTKLIWAGIKYLASASAALISLNLFTSPIKTVKDFYGEFKMVFNCHQERKYMMETQRHLTNWVPIACPFTEWNIWPPPFGHWLFSFFPILAPGVFKFYDSLSGFSCPSSFIMGKKKAQELFPQLNEKDIKYCAVFYEGQHNDARTNVAIALSAAEKGAHIANYVEMTEGIFEEGGKKMIGVKALDKITGKEFEIYAKNIIFAGGPFTDALRKKEAASEGKEVDVKAAVQGASGSHIVLPGYYAPKEMGLLDYNTSDGRFLFFLPWQGSVIVGTTDKKGPAETLPKAPEEEIQWLLKESEKYLSHSVKVRRSDVLSAWRGWRPLAADPHAPPGGQVSRDHVISTNPDTGVTFIAGGKWTTWREMAEDVLDKVLEKSPDFQGKVPKCNTLDLKLLGGEGYSENLSVQLIQKYGMEQGVAEHLVKTYGGRVWEVAELAKATGKRWPRFGVVLHHHYPYIEAEVRYACQEYACTIEDILSRRTRIAFLNHDVASEVLPRIADIMAEELKWSRKTKAEQIARAEAYLEAYGGRIPQDEDLKQRLTTHEDAMDVFNEIDTDGSGYLDEQEIKEIAIRLGKPLSDEKVKVLFRSMDTNKDGKVQAEEFITWMEKDEDESGVLKVLTEEYSLGGKSWLQKKGGGGSFLG